MRWTLLAVVVLTHYGYYLADSPQQAENWFYVLRGVEGTALFYMLTRFLKDHYAIVICWLGAFEESQTAICGLSWTGGSIPLTSGLCLESYGYWPYAIIAATAILFLRGRHARES